MASPWARPDTQSGPPAAFTAVVNLCPSFSSCGKPMAWLSPAALDTSLISTSLIDEFFFAYPRRLTHLHPSVADEMTDCVPSSLL